MGRMISALLAIFLILHSTNGEETVQLLQRLQSKMNSLDSKVKVLEQENVRLNSIIGKLSSNSQSGSPKDGEAASCYELRLSNPILPSGEYTIDADGDGSLPPFSVYCDMTTGTTLVSHNLEGTASVDSCATPGCYSKPVAYGTQAAPITPEQMAKLIEISEGCRQNIRYDCTYAPLAFNGIQYSWWQDRVGTKRYYWSGNGDGQDDSYHICQCGLDGSTSCIDPSVPCNCDALSVEPSADSGVLTSKAHLPVTLLAFGRTSYGISSGNHTLGKLECYGRQKFTAKPTKCSELSLIGQLNGYYLLPDGDKAMKVVYCDMLKGDEETRIGSVDIQSKTVYFHATSNPTSTAGTITYGTPVINEGGSLDAGTGIFTAPVSGVHLFTSITYGKTGSSVKMLWKKPADSAFSDLSTAAITADGSLVINVEVELENGTQLKVDLISGEVVSGMFSGALLRENLVSP